MKIRLQKSILTILLCIGWALPSYTQANDPKGFNDYFSKAALLSPDSIYLDALVPGEWDIVKFNISQCRENMLRIVFPDYYTNPENLAELELFLNNDTVNPILKQTIGGMSPSNCLLFRPGNYFIRLKSVVPTPINQYVIAVQPDTIDQYECNNKRYEAREININQSVDFRLYGFQAGGAPDEEWFSITVPQCGILNTQINNAGDDQKIVLTVFDESANLIDRFKALEDGGLVVCNTQLSPGKYYIQIAEFDTCCGTGNDIKYNPGKNLITLDLHFDSSDPTECNNTFETAYPINTNTNYQLKLWGRNLLNPDQPEDQDFIKYTSPACGVLDLLFSGVPDDLMLSVDVYNENRILINEGLASCHGCELQVSTKVSANQTVYIKIHEYNGCCTGNYAIYNLSPYPFTIRASLDTTDTHECNDSFSSATSVSENANLSFKIKGLNLLGRYGTADTDFFKIYSNNCSKVDVVISGIPYGFDVYALVYDDTNNIENQFLDMRGTWPDTLKFSFDLPAGKNYYLLLKGAPGLSSDKLMQAQFTFTKQGPEAPVITANPGLNICEGESLTLTSSAPFNNRWSTGDTTQTITITKPGFYIDTLYGSGVCYVISDTIFIVSKNPPLADFEFAFENNAFHFYASAQENASYSWNFGDNFSSTDMNPVHAYQIPGEFPVRLIVTNECASDTAEKMVNSSVGLESVMATNLKVFPQPSTGQFTVQGLSYFHGTMNYQVVDTYGRVRSAGQINNQDKIRLELNLPDGVYFLNLNGQNKIPLLILNQ